MNHSCLKFISQFGRNSFQVYIRVNFPRNRAKLRTLNRPDRVVNSRGVFFFSAMTYRRRRYSFRVVSRLLSARVGQIDRQGKC